MPDVMRFRDIAILMYEHIRPVLGLNESWDTLPYQQQIKWVRAVKTALMNADYRGLIRILPDDHDESIIEQL